MSLPQAARISVAMCTYNGERFLRPQLDSMAGQTRLPDELVVCDDRSTDGTVPMLRRFAAAAPFPVRLFENPQTLGFAANFEAAIRRTEGDLIALSDQDDLWYPTRLERSEQQLALHPEAGVVFSDADLIDENNRKLDGTLWQRLHFDRRRRRQLLTGQYTVLAKHRFVTGATMMFRSALRDRCLPVAGGWVHDEWIAMVAAAFSGLLPIEEPLIRYRLHGSQQVGLVNKFERNATGGSGAERHWHRVAQSARELQQLCQVLADSEIEPDKQVLSAYRRHLEFLEFRADLPAPWPQRAVRVAASYRSYRVHASGLSSAVKDMVLRKR